MPRWKSLAGKAALRRLLRDRLKRQRQTIGMVPANHGGSESARVVARTTRLPPSFRLEARGLEQLGAAGKVVRNELRESLRGLRSGLDAQPAIVLALSAPLVLAQGGGAGGGGGTGGGAAGSGAGGAAGTGAASPSGTTASPGMAPSSVTGGTTGAGAAPPSGGTTAPGNPIPSGTGPAPERTPGQSSSTPSHNVPTTGAPAGVPRATAPTHPPSGQATLPTNPPAGGKVTAPATSGRGGGTRSGTDKPLGGMDVTGTPKIMNDPSLGPIR
jgi:hypothetical protein